MIISYKRLSRIFCFIFLKVICNISKLWETMKNFDVREYWIYSISSLFLEHFYSFRAQMSQHYIIRNGFLGTKQWTFSFKKQCCFGAKLNFLECQSSDYMTLPISPVSFLMRELGCTISQFTIQRFAIQRCTIHA